MEANRCYACHRKLQNNVVEVQNQFYHEECFTCTQCDKPLSNAPFRMHNDVPYCQEHYYERFGKRCDDCGEIIQGCEVTALGKSYHKEHFRCWVCKKPFPTTSFLKKEFIIDDVAQMKPICRDCFTQNFSERCYKCGKGVGTENLVAMGRCWHPDCFRCTCCNKVFDPSMKFCVIEGNPWCISCSNSKRASDSIKYTPTSKCVTTTTCTHTDTPSRPAPPSSPVMNTTTTTTTTTTGTPSSPYYSHTTKTTSTTTTVQPSTSRSSFSKPPPRVPSIHSFPVTLANSSEQTVSESIHEPAMDPMESPISPSPASPKPGTSSVQTYKKTVTITTTEAILCPNCNTPHLSNATACTTCGYKFNQDENEFNMIQEHIKSIPDNELPIYPYSQLISPPYPANVDTSRRECHLAPDEFQKLFGYNYEDFKKLPQWKQKDLKKKLKLF